MQAALLPERTQTARTCIGRVASVFLAYGRESTAREVRHIDLTWVGVRGDRHASAQRAADARTPWHPKGCQIANTRHVSIVSLEECAELAASLGLPTITPDLLSANIACTAVAGLSSPPRRPVCSSHQGLQSTSLTLTNPVVKRGERLRRLITGLISN